MNLLRKAFDNFYDFSKPFIFKLTEKDPEKAHKIFTNFLKFLHTTGLEKEVLDNSANSYQTQIKISNAAGFNKNGEISLSALKYLGFDRIVVGTVTGDSWEGNPRPRTKRFPKTQSLVNWMGLPGAGVEQVAENIYCYDNPGIPTTINFMSTPEKTGEKLLRDLEKTITQTRHLDYVDRYELNISCPNTHSGSGELDARNEHSKILREMLETVSPLLQSYQELGLKVSPDLTEEDVDNILEIAQDFPIKGYTTTNTTTNHNPEFIPESPGKGGASGNAVYNDSLRVQKLFYEKTKNNLYRSRLIACGGISTTEKLMERIAIGASEIQIYTPLIFSGPRLLRDFREYMRI